MKMRQYETLLLFSPELAAENIQEQIEALSQIITRDQGSIITVDDWGSRELAYAVNKHMRGHYVRVEYVAPSSVVQELERIIRITDGIYKFITVKLADSYTPASEEAAPEAEPQTEEA